MLGVNEMPGILPQRHGQVNASKQGFFNVLKSGSLSEFRGFSGENVYPRYRSRLAFFSGSLLREGRRKRDETHDH